MWRNNWTESRRTQRTRTVFLWHLTKWQALGWCWLFPGHWCLLCRFMHLCSYCDLVLCLLLLLCYQLFKNFSGWKVDLFFGWCGSLETIYKTNENCSFLLQMRIHLTCHLLSFILNEKTTLPCPLPCCCWNQTMPLPFSEAWALFVPLCLLLVSPEIKREVSLYLPLIYVKWEINFCTTYKWEI